VRQQIIIIIVIIHIIIIIIIVIIVFICQGNNATEAVIQNSGQDKSGNKAPSP